MEKAATRRLFLALWPDNDTRLLIKKNVDKVATYFSGKRIPEQNIHLTLSFLGPVGLSTQDCIERVASTASLAPSQLVLDKVDYWPKPDLLCLCCSNAPETLTRFVSELNDGFRKCHIDISSRPFVPHVTLVRKIDKIQPQIQIDPVIWPVNKFVLVESKTLLQGVNYTLLKQWG